MKRYRPLMIDFDSRARTLAELVRDDWDPQTKELHEANKRGTVVELILEFGAAGAEQKIQNFLDLGDKPFSVVSFHNRFYEQARRAFVTGAYYPALTGACALGERILNHLMLRLRDDFSDAPRYGEVATKKSFSNWRVVLDILEDWDVLVPPAASAFRHLMGLRNRSLHFDPDTDRDERSPALAALRSLTTIVGEQFAPIGRRPWFMENTPGESYVSKEWEHNPFVKRILIPCCHLVGPLHTVRLDGNRWIIQDDHSYPDREVTDEEFAQMRSAGRVT